MSSLLKNNSKIHLKPEQMQFSLFTAEQIKKLSVVKIVTPLMLDNLGHPLPGGLYDARLGPLKDKSESCATCKKMMAVCPGHFGHIELPLPCINPLFHRIIGNILRISCLNCHRMQIPAHLKTCLIIQVKLLNCGLLTLATEVEAEMSELISKFSTLENISEESIVSITKYEKLADGELEKLGGRPVNTQNIEALRNHYVNTLWKDSKVRKVCKYCKKSIDSIQVLKNKIIMRMKEFSKEEGNQKVQKSRVIGFVSKYVNPQEAKMFMREIWKQEKEFLQQLLSVLSDIDAEHPTDAFFFDVVPVTPTNVRPVNVVLDRVLESKQSTSYKNVMQNVILLKAIVQVVQTKGDQDSLSSAEAKAAYSFARGNTPIEKLNNAWEELQNDINCLVDNGSVRGREGLGLKQIIEKKDGIVRMNMMGKRVNYSARSVITPDPNLNIDEIGIPEKFAMHLTYPVAVTPWNVEELRKMIMNGPNVHPGATMIEINGAMKRIHPDNETQQSSILKCLLTPDEKGKGSTQIKIVHRHLMNGDVLLLNRQPTLHKPSIMAHTARILKGEKTLRLHYANCKAYNADFDGDEMNAHFPQNELARSEGYNIVNVSNQYLVPKDGTPLSGLIQDHMISGVRLSMRGRFFNKHDYQQLVFQALSFKKTEIVLLPPAILKPQRLWSGKQILSTVIVNIIPKGRELINLTATAKINARAWQSEPPRKWSAGGTPFPNWNTMSEAEVVIRGGELLVGVLDKTHYGATPYGLVHCINELYGGMYATRLLSSLAKLFMRFLQQDGFTLGVHDILTVKMADLKRKEIIKKSREIGVDVITTALDLKKSTPLQEIVEKIEARGVTNKKTRAIIDRSYKSALDSFTNDINRTCLPAGLLCKFPHNNLQLMVLSGAKGSTVNTMQISCLLGQIELEGRRPPVMVSGKSLPSFPASEFTPRAGGFIDGRFMTGIQPQEFFFHCMAGREGLIDTAVKTSRSGYLQRCLIKHLEGLQVGYDMTVRNSDGSVIQFMYGEDGLDISKAQFLNSSQLKFLSENTKALTETDVLKQLTDDKENKHKIKEHREKVRSWYEKYGVPSKTDRRSPFTIFSRHIADRIGSGKKMNRSKIVQLWYDLERSAKETLEEECERCPDPLSSVYQPDSHFGSLNEHLERLVDGFEDGSKRKKKEKKLFKNVMRMKVMRSMCSPGEPVGLLAAQSIGEPSTQMTLNTFHFAGRGDMNVTLGIPRLREILMMASKNIKTPSMEIPFLPVENIERKAASLRKMLNRVVVADVLEKVDVSAELQLRPARQHRYALRFCFLPPDCYGDEFHVDPKRILSHMKRRFFGEMFNAINKFNRVKSGVVAMEEAKEKKKNNRNEDEDEGEDDKNEDNEWQGKREKEGADGASSSEDEIEDEEDAKQSSKYTQSHEDQEPEDEERENSDNEPEFEDEEIMKRIPETEESTVLNSYNFAQNYAEDEKRHLWCELTFVLPLTYKKLDLTVLLKETAAKSIIWQTPNIKRAITYMNKDKLMLRTDGINIVEMFKYRALLDLEKLYCNDIHKMAETYGIEAALKIIVKEVKDVFNVYGIKVDPRHLSLIADYMTFNGVFEPLNRKGMESSASSLQQISFESSLTFLKNATIKGRRDDLSNPSSSLMVGNLCKTGTGCFNLIQKGPNLNSVK